MGYFPTDKQVIKQNLIPDCPHSIQIKIDNCAFSITPRGIRIPYKCMICGVLFTHVDMKLGVYDENRDRQKGL